MNNECIKNDIDFVFAPLDKSSAAILEYIGKADYVTVPSSCLVDGELRLVTRISDEAFKNVPNLKSIRFSENIKDIGSAVAKGCLDLEEVWLPSSLTRLGEGAFSDCPKLKKICFSDGGPITLGKGFAMSCSPDLFLFFEGENRFEEDDRYIWSDQSIARYCGSSIIASDGLEYALCRDGEGNKCLLCFCWHGNASKEAKIPSSMRIGENECETRIDDVGLSSLFGNGLRFLTIEGKVLGLEDVRYPLFYDNEFDYIGTYVPLAYGYAGIHGEKDGVCYALCKGDESREYITLLGYKPNVANKDIDELRLPSSIDINGREVMVKEVARDGFPYFGSTPKVKVPKGINIGKRAFSWADGLSIA